METFGRGCLYIIIGAVILFVIALVLGIYINIPWFIAIPLIVLAFVVAANKSKKNRGD